MILQSLCFSATEAFSHWTRRKLFQRMRINGSAWKFVGSLMCEDMVVIWIGKRTGSKRGPRDLQFFLGVNLIMKRGIDSPNASLHYLGQSEYPVGGRKGMYCVGAQSECHLQGPALENDRRRALCLWHVSQGGQGATCCHNGAAGLPQGHTK